MKSFLSFVVIFMFFLISFNVYAGSGQNGKNAHKQAKAGENAVEKNEITQEEKKISDELNRCKEAVDVIGKLIAEYKKKPKNYTLDNLKNWKDEIESIEKEINTIDASILKKYKKLKADYDQSQVLVKDILRKINKEVNSLILSQVQTCINKIEPLIKKISDNITKIEEMKEEGISKKRDEILNYQQTLDALLKEQKELEDTFTNEFVKVNPLDTGAFKALKKTIEALNTRINKLLEEIKNPSPSPSTKPEENLNVKQDNKHGKKETPSPEPSPDDENTSQLKIRYKTDDRWVTLFFGFIGGIAAILVLFLILPIFSGKQQRRGNDTPDTQGMQKNIETQLQGGQTLLYIQQRLTQNEYDIDALKASINTIFRTANDVTKERQIRKGEQSQDRENDYSTTKDRWPATEYKTEPKGLADRVNDFIQQYNEDVNTGQIQLTTKFDITKIGIQNMQELINSQTAKPIFEVMLSGNYWCIKEQDVYLAVPRPLMPLRADDYHSNALNQVFMFTGYNPNLIYRKINVKKPAVFKLSGTNAQIYKKGELILGRGEPA
ncbi:MAG: hypothetical protein HQK92_02410 [Nitrospirae bacterium]|nr:hypothetical protein [Nitrospirota bacterium]